MSLDSALQTLKAAADPTRLRLLTVLADGEATVGELQEILEQSQPRVSRHLRLLDEAGLVTKFRDGRWIYYRLAATAGPGDIVHQLITLAGDEPILDSDREALSRVKRNREKDAYNVGGSWRGAGVAGDRPDASSLVEAVEESVGDGRFGDVLQVGCGNGALLGLLGKRARSVVGLDDSKRVRMLARSRAHQSGLTSCTVRNASLAELPFADGSFDLVVLNEILCAIGDGAGADLQTGLREAVRVLRRDGRLVIVDRIEPVARKLPVAATGGPLYENNVTAPLSELGCKVTSRIWFPGRAMEYALFAAAPDVSLMRTGTDD